MGRQREQMTLNNPDILFIHLSAAWKDGISGNEISHVESTMHILRAMQYLRVYIYAFYYYILLYLHHFTFNLHDMLMKKSLSR